jgi:hypothetical protein
LPRGLRPADFCIASWVYGFILAEMSRLKLSTRLLVFLALALGGATLGAAAADTAPSGILQPVTADTVSHPVDTVSTAEDYKQMQDSAPEVVVLRVTAVKTEAGKAADDSVQGIPLMVTAKAAVIRVVHTATGLKAGDVVYLLYGYAQPVPGKSSYTPIPIISNNTEYTAYLVAGADKNVYRPAAGAQSFIDNAARAANGSSASGPLADPTLLPAPDNPTPVGVPRLTHTNLAQFVKATQANGRWVVSIAEADPVPLQMAGNEKPTLLAYYPAAIRAPATQPKILIYQAGTTAANTPAEVTTERALIVDGNSRLLGDVVWAWRVPDGQPPRPLPIWRWSTYKLEVEDPTTHAVQTILLDGSGAPATGQN